MTLRWFKHALLGKSAAGSSPGPDPDPDPDPGSGSGSGSGPGGDFAAKLRPTAYLDGLRGFSAFIVYFHHHQLWVHSIGPEDGSGILESSYGWHGERHMATLPILRTFITGGHFAVAIFYVISGYVLSVRTLSLLQAGEAVKAFDTVASALFRRWFRIWIPLAVTTFVYILSFHFTGMYPHSYPVKPTCAAEIWSWYTEFKNFSFLYKEGIPWLSYNMHLWTIPLEMRGSVVTYITLLTVIRAPTARRLLVQCLLIFYFLYVADGWYVATFLAGMLQCDLDLLARRPDGAGFPSFLRRLEPHKMAIYHVLFVLAMLLSGVPSHTDKIEDLRANPGWYWLSKLKPQAVFDPKWFFLAVAANFLVAAAARLTWLRRFLEAPFCQWLGRISFALYLVHGPVMATIGDRVYHAVGWVRFHTPGEPDLSDWINLVPLPRGGPLGFEPAFWLPQLVLLPLTLWLAVVVTRLVDQPAIAVSAWLHKWSMGNAGPLWGAGPAAKGLAEQPLTLTTQTPETVNLLRVV